MPRFLRLPNRAVGPANRLVGKREVSFGNVSMCSRKDCVVEIARN